MKPTIQKTFMYAAVDPSEMVIEAQVAEKNNPARFHPICFKVTSVDYLQHVDEISSALVLKSGVVIPVALAYAKLKAMVFPADDAVSASLDLSLVTGPRAVQVGVAPLMDELKENTMVVVRATLRKPVSNLCKQFEFSETDVASFRAVDGTRAKKGRSVLVTFNAEAAVLPFNLDDAYIDMPYDDFMKFYTEAKAQRKEMLDLLDIFARNPDKYGL